MAEMLYASFSDLEMAERAAGALLDHGMLKDDISLISHERHADRASLESKAKGGITTTTAADAESGAVKGGAIGAAIGIVAGLASLIIPGFGLVTGGGALATAIGSAIGTAAGGAIAGGVTGYLKDQGVPESAAARYEEVVRGGGALISMTLPSGEVDRDGAEDILRKYHAHDIGAFARGMPQERAYPRSGSLESAETRRMRHDPKISYPGLDADQRQEASAARQADAEHVDERERERRQAIVARQADEEGLAERARDLESAEEAQNVEPQGVREEVLALPAAPVEKPLQATVEGPASHEEDDVVVHETVKKTILRKSKRVKEEIIIERTPLGDEPPSA